MTTKPDPLVIGGKLLPFDVCQTIAEFEGYHVIIDKAIVDGSLNISRATCRKLTLRDTKVNGDVILESLNGLDVVHFSKVRLANLSIMDCEIGKDVILHEISTNGALEIDGLHCKHSIHLENIIFGTVAIRRSRAPFFRYENTVSSASAVQYEFIMARSDFSDEILLSGMDRFVKITVQRCHAVVFLLVKTSVPSGASVLLEDCQINTANLSGTEVAQKASISIHGCEVHILNSALTLLDDSSFTMDGTIVSQVANLDIHYGNRCRINVSNAYFQKLRMNSALAISSLEPQVSPLFFRMSPEENIDTAKIVKRMFNEEHDFGREDKAFYIMKQMEENLFFTLFRKNLNFGSIISAFIYALYRILFGWGVRIRNPLVSIASLIAFFAFIYYWLAFYSSSAYITIMGFCYHGVGAAFLFSLTSILNLDPPDARLQPVMAYLYLGEFIIGLLYATLLIGIIIRKLVR